MSQNSQQQYKGLKRLRTGGKQTRMKGVLREFSQQNGAFKKACELANVQNTRRQASRWFQQRGSAWKMRVEATEALRN